MSADWAFRTWSYYIPDRPRKDENRVWRVEGTKDGPGGYTTVSVEGPTEQEARARLVGFLNLIDQVDG